MGIRKQQGCSNGKESRKRKDRNHYCGIHGWNEQKSKNKNQNHKIKGVMEYGEERGYRNNGLVR